jgi:hypothetical protein
MKTIVGTLIALLMISGSAKAFDTGNDLLEACTQKHTEYACVMYIRAVGNTISLKMEYTRNEYARKHSISSDIDAIPLSAGTMCHETPSGVTTGQVKDVVTKSLENYPKTRHFGATYLVAFAISRAWPCPGGVQP